MSSLRIEILGVILVFLLVTVVVVIRHLLIASRGDRPGATGPGEDPYQPERAPAGASTAADFAGDTGQQEASAFGPAPVWAGGGSPATPERRFGPHPRRAGGSPNGAGMDREPAAVPAPPGGLARVTEPAPQPLGAAVGRGVPAVRVPAPDVTVLASDGPAGNTPSIDEADDPPTAVAGPLFRSAFDPPAEVPPVGSRPSGEAPAGLPPVGPAGIVSPGVGEGGGNFPTSSGHPGSSWVEEGPEEPTSGDALGAPPAEDGPTDPSSGGDAVGAPTFGSDPEDPTSCGDAVDVPRLDEGTADPGWRSVAVGFSGGHDSRLLHVSGLQDDVAEDVPTDWMVLTPLDPLGSWPAGPRAPINGDDRRIVHPRDEVVDPPGVDTQDQSGGPSMDPPSASGPNPFAAPADEAPRGDSGSDRTTSELATSGPDDRSTGADGAELGLPSGLLADLLGLES